MSVFLIDFQFSLLFGLRFVPFGLLRFSSAHTLLFPHAHYLSLSLSLLLPSYFPCEREFVHSQKKFLSGSVEKYETVKQCDGVGITLPSA